MHAPHLVACAAEIGLGLHRPIAAPFQASLTAFEGASFKRLKRILGPDIGIEHAHATDWMHGTRSGAEVIVRPFGSFARVCVRIEPSLLLGMAMQRHDGVEAALGIGVRTGYMPLDTLCRIDSHDARRAAQLLRPRTVDGHDLAQRIVMLARNFHIHISDTMVTVRVPLDVLSLTDAMDNAAWIANDLVARRVELGETAREHGQREQWKAFADSHGLAFDPVRMDLHGRVGAGALRVCLDTERGQIVTLCSITFDTHVGAWLRMPRPRVLLGFPKDTAYRHRSVLARLARRDREIDLSDVDLLVRAEGSTPLSRDLSELVTETAHAAALVLEGSQVHAGPYR